MRLIIDGDGTPMLSQIAMIAKENECQMIVFCDYAHMIEGDFIVKQVPIGQDSVDYAILNSVQKNDVVITQDYGLASMLQTKLVTIIHPNGYEINEQNIDQLLMQRFIGQKQRKSGIRSKIKKRTKEDNYKLLQLVEAKIKK